MKKILLSFSATLIIGLVFVSSIFAEITCETVCNKDDTDCLKKVSEQCTSQIADLKTKANTLSNQIAAYNAQINLAELKVQQTEDEIKLLGGRIDQVGASLTALNEAFSARAVLSYKMARTEEPSLLLLSAEDLTKAVSKFHYLQKVEDYDQNLIVKLKSAQDTYIADKKQSEDLQKKLQEQSDQLNAQKATKARLLADTKGSEANYQRLLAQAQAELNAILSITAGKGEETEVGHVNEGDKIASIIPGPSACSSGAHLHFEVVQDKAHQNPANFLSPKGIVWDDGPDGPFNFSGSWQWPINDPVRITQGYGMTYYAAVLRYYGGAPHTGIDMLNDNGDFTVKAVRSGNLFRGGIACGGGTLRYVHIVQDGGMDTYYLHVNYY